MRRSIAIALLLNAFFLASLFWQELNVHAQEETCSTTNGDVNGDDLLDMSDAIALLHGLFLGGPAPLPTCQSQGRSGVPDTGQHMCHDPAGEEIPCAGEDFRGQDGAYSTGCPSEGRFVDNENAAP